jgi:hypothetical protein
LPYRIFEALCHHKQRTKVEAGEKQFDPNLVEVFPSKTGQEEYCGIHPPQIV